MQIQVHTDANVQGSEQLAAEVRAAVNGALGHLADHVSRVEVHLGDENGKKGGADDKRCMIEARVEGRPPIAITHHAATVALAVDGAADRLRRSLEEARDRAQEARHHPRPHRP